MLWRSLIISLTVLFAFPQTGLTQETTTTEPRTATDTAAIADEPVPERSSRIRADHFVPAFDIVLFDFLLNRYGYRFVDRDSYAVDRSSITRNLRSAWVTDNDPFGINQFMHPYQGSMYHGFARSAGLNFWQSLGYTFAGSMLWEIAGETTLPSKNDQVASGIGGSFLGEPLFRLSELMLAHGDGFWRGLAAAAISPATGFNRLAYGDRFRATYPSRDPAVFTRVQFGLSGTASVQKSFGQPLTRTETVADFTVDYGLPGKPGYGYHRPFDNFSLQFTSSTGSHVESIFIRGLLAGRSYGADGDASRGVWGLYGSYDYVAPQIFRVSNTAVGLGTTLQRRLASSSVLQSTILAGVGYGAGGGLGGENENDYHYGLTPQLLAAVRVVPGDRAAFELTVRDYYISRVASTQLRGSENVTRADAQVSFRLARHHAASVKYIWSRRAASGPPDLGSVTQARSTVGLFYTFLGGAPFGAVRF